MPERPEATQKITVHVSSIFRRQDLYVAVVDGRGENYAHQSEIAKAADLLCVMLDHSILEASEDISAERITRHREFGTRVREALAHQWSEHPRDIPLKVHLLLNKKDRWSVAPQDE